MGRETGPVEIHCFYKKSRALRFRFGFLPSFPPRLPLAGASPSQGVFKHSACGLLAAEGHPADLECRFESKFAPSV